MLFTVGSFHSLHAAWVEQQQQQLDDYGLCYLQSTTVSAVQKLVGESFKRRSYEKLI